VVGDPCDELVADNVVTPGPSETTTSVAIMDYTPVHSPTTHPTRLVATKLARETSTSLRTHHAVGFEQIGAAELGPHEVGVPHYHALARPQRQSSAARCVAGV